jgi:hypothetical protein
LKRVEEELNATIKEKEKMISQLNETQGKNDSLNLDCTSNQKLSKNTHKNCVENQ